MGAWGKVNVGGASALMIFAASAVENLPSAPDGSIGIITSNTITSAYTDNDALASPSEGMLHVETTARTTAPIALTNRIKIYPWRATQYLSSVWVGKVMYVRYGGAWVSPSSLLYYLGAEYPQFSGGWQSRGWAGASGTFSMGTVSLTKNADHMLLVGSGTAYGCYVAEVISNIDLTNYTTLAAVINNVSYNAYVADAIRLIVVSRTATYWLTSKAASVVFANTLDLDQTQSVDVSALNGSYDVLIGVYNATTTGCQTKIKEVRLAA